MYEAWGDLTAEINECRKCRLCEKRTTVVPGEGNPNADIMFIGEGPGRETCREGRLSVRAVSFWIG